MTVTAIAPAEAGVEVGTFFADSWGYDQTNVDFYRVMGLTPKGVRLQKWSNRTTHDDGRGPVTHVVPGDGPAKVTVWPDKTQQDLDECRHGCPVDGYFPYRGCPDHGPREHDAPVLTKRLSTYGGTRPYVAVGSYDHHAYLWDGSPMYETASGWGH